MYYTQPKVNNSEYQMHEGKERKEEAWKYGPEGKGVERRRVGRGGKGKGREGNGKRWKLGGDGEHQSLYTYCHMTSVYDSAMAVCIYILPLHYRIQKSQCHIWHHLTLKQP